MMGKLGSVKGRQDPKHSVWFPATDAVRFWLEAMPRVGIYAASAVAHVALLRCLFPSTSFDVGVN